MVATRKARTKRNQSRSQKFKKAVLGRPQGVIQPRVQQVGPERFGIVAVDCAKARSRWMLTDFYGNVIVEPTDVEHNRNSFQRAVLKSKLQCQIRHHVELGLPGFAALFNGDDLWTQATPVPLLREISARGGTVDVVQEAGQKGLVEWMKATRIRCHQKTLERVTVWAANAADSDPMARFHTRVWLALLDDWQQKNLQIQQCERDLAGLLVQTPYVLLLSHPGINVVSAAELAGELGPIENYASSKAIAGRAGLFPSRYQSDKVDRGGNLTRFRNARLRAAFMLIADNMLKCNAWWMLKADVWRQQGVKSADLHARVANRMTRVVFQMVSGRQIYRHPSRLDRGYVMDKLLTFYREHTILPAVTVRDLQQASKQLQPHDQKPEGEKLREAALRARRSRQKGPQELGALLVGLLAKLGIAADNEAEIEST